MPKTIAEGGVADPPPPRRSAVNEANFGQRFREGTCRSAAPLRRTSCAGSGAAVDDSTHERNQPEASWGDHVFVRFTGYLLIALLLGLEVAYVVTGLSRSTMLVRGQ